MNRVGWKGRDKAGYSLSTFAKIMATGAHFADATGAAQGMPLKP